MYESSLDTPQIAQGFWNKSGGENFDLGELQQNISHQYELE